MQPVEGGAKKYRYSNDLDELTVEKVTEFVREFKEGSLKPFYKSAEIVDD